MPPKKKGSRSSNSKTAHVLNLITTVNDDPTPEEAEVVEAVQPAPSPSATAPESPGVSAPTSVPPVATTPTPPVVPAPPVAPPPPVTAPPPQATPAAAAPPVTTEAAPVATAPPVIAETAPVAPAPPAAAPPQGNTSTVEVAFTDDDTLASQIQNALNSQLLADLEAEPPKTVTMPKSIMTTVVEAPVRIKSAPTSLEEEGVGEEEEISVPDFLGGDPFPEVEEEELEDYIPEPVSKHAPSDPVEEAILPEDEELEEEIPAPVMKEVSEPVAEEIIPEPVAEEIPEPVAEEIPEPIMEESFPDPEPVPMPTTAEMPVEDVADVEEIPEPVAEEIPEPVAEEILEPIAEEILEPIMEELPEPVAEEIPAPVAEEIPEPVAEEIPEPVVEELPEPVAEEISEPVAEEIPEPVAEEIPEPVAEEIIPEPVAEESFPDPEPVPMPTTAEIPVEEVEEISEPVAEELPEPVAEEIPEPVAEEIPEPVAEELPEPVVEEIPEPVAEEILEPVAEEIPEPVAEEIPEPVAEELPEPVVEEIPEPVAEEIPEPVMEEIIPEPIPQPVTEQVAEAPPQGEAEPQLEAFYPPVFQEEIPEAPPSFEEVALPADPPANPGEPKVTEAVFPKISLNDAENFPPEALPQEAEPSEPPLQLELPPRSLGTAPTMEKEEETTYIPTVPSAEELKPLISQESATVPPEDVLDLLDSSVLAMHQEETELSMQIQDALQEELLQEVIDEIPAPELPSLFLDPILPPEAENPSSISLGPSVPLELGTMPEGDENSNASPEHLLPLENGLEEADLAANSPATDPKNPMLGRRLGEPVEYYNLTEILVRDLAPSSLQTFGTCTCDQCLLDVIAHCLSQLPPKYVVRYHGGYETIYEAYKKEYGSAIVSQLGKSCMFVNESPRHLKAFMAD